MNNKKGVSLPIIIGLLTLLMVTAAAINELVIKNALSIRRIEAANRAFLAAEAGVEDALYELSQHSAGYETPPLGSGNVRTANFGDPRWYNEWTVESHPDYSNASNYSGTLKENQELIISFYNDDTGFAGVGTNAIRTAAENVNAEKSNTFSISFSVPQPHIDYIGSNSVLTIDNDGDYTAIGNVNEENGGLDNEDLDGDGLLHEDSDTDPVIIWKLTDSAGNEVYPLPECIHTGAPNESRICESDFFNGNSYTVTLSNLTEGIDRNGNVGTLGSFINSFGNTDKIQFEFRIVAPLENVDVFNQQKLRIPHLEYTVDTNLDIPYPYYVIRSDGFYRGYKQSITTTLSPRTLTPLLDFTIIQN